LTAAGSNKEIAGATPRSRMVRPVDVPRLPPSAVLHKNAVKDLKRLDPAAAASLLEAFTGRCLERHLPRQDEALPTGKGRGLRSIRITYCGGEFRLIYATVRPAKSPASKRPGATRRPGARPIRFLGLLAWSKKQDRVGSPRAATAWARADAWFADHPEYRRG
jgi:mRNA-degrading endonuclease RelE of RelBE toxin-antitoxin system